jgi:capsular polysaccharide biosynthesis protein
MSMLKVDHDRQPDLALERTDLRAHYENVAGRTLSAITRQWKLVGAVAGLTVGLACMAIPLMPRQYSATALVYPSLFAAEEGKALPLGTVDAGSLVNSEARLIVSDTVLQNVVRHLELGASSEVSQKSWMTAAQDWVRTLLLPETRNHSAFDRQVALLRNKVDVSKDTRSYLISITFMTRSPDEAARVVNTIALEYARGRKILRAETAVVAAENELSRQLSVYGEKHPKVLQARDRVDSAREWLGAAVASGENGANAPPTEEGVRLAVPNRTPTSPKGLVILGLSFLGGLLAGISLAWWRDRAGYSPHYGVLGLLSSQFRTPRR